MQNFPLLPKARVSTSWLHGHVHTQNTYVKHKLMPVGTTQTTVKDFPLTRTHVLIFIILGLNLKHLSCSAYAWYKKLDIQIHFPAD